MDDLLENCTQRSPAWFQARCGSLGASSLAEALAKTKSGWGAGRANVMARLIAERLTGVPQESFTSAAMQHGIDTEAEARASYEFYCDQDVTEVGIVFHPAITGTHASPDGLAGKCGLVEIKCPNTATHLDYLLTGSIPDKYVVQMNWQMACTGREWCDFVSFDPRLPEEMRLFVKRIDRDGERIADLEKNVREFLAELDGKVQRLREKFGISQPSAEATTQPKAEAAPAPQEDIPQGCTAHLSGSGYLEPGAREDAAPLGVSLTGPIRYLKYAEKALDLAKSLEEIAAIEARMIDSIKGADQIKDAVARNKARIEGVAA